MSAPALLSETTTTANSDERACGPIHVPVASAARSQRQKLWIDPYYNTPTDGRVAGAPASPAASVSPPTDMSDASADESTPTSGDDDWRLCVVLCLYDFSSPDPDHLSFRKNELLEIVKKEPSGWWAALRADRIGWVPSAFVVPLTDGMADFLRTVREDARVAEYNAERLCSVSPAAVDTAHIFDATPSPEDAHGQREDDWLPLMALGSKVRPPTVLRPAHILTFSCRFTFPDAIHAPLAVRDYHGLPR